MLSLYSDGGCIWDGKNYGSRSTIGGTYAFVIVDEDGLVTVEKSGVIDAEMLGHGGSITNNVSELYALAYGIMHLPEGCECMIYSDSEVTLGRIFSNHSLNNVPPWLRELTFNARLHLRKVALKGYALLGGHPTRADLVSGFRKDKLPCSAWNVRADKMCNQAGIDFRLLNGNTE